MSEPGDTPLIAARVLAEHSHLSIPSLPNWIAPTVEYLRHKALLCGACQETRSGKVMIALHEAINNALLHGNLELSSTLKERGDDCFAAALAHAAADPALTSRTVDVVVDFDGDVCRWIITDEGQGFDVERVLARCLSDDPEILLASGRGILMMKAFLDDVRFERDGRQVILTLNRASGSERRDDPRVPLHRSLQVTPLLPDGTANWPATYEAVSRNFSEQGISLLQNQLAPAQRILIGIPRNHEIVYVTAEVKHLRSLGGNGMELGCQFTELPLADGDPSKPSLPPAPPQEALQRAITDLLQDYQAQQALSHEQRIHPRIVFNERVRIGVEDRTEPVVGYARDLSKGGMALICQEAMAGQITIQFHEPARGLKVRCQIVRCTRIKEGFYDVGVTFLHLDPKANAKELTP